MKTPLTSQSRATRLSTLLLVVFSLNLILPLTISAADLTPDRSIQLELNPNENPLRKKMPLSYELKPTKSLEDVLTIKNFSPDKAFTVKVYAVDSLQGSDGAVAFKLEDRPRSHIGQWVTFNQETVRVAAGATAFVPYRLDVPDQTPPGTYQGGLVAELVDNNGIVQTTNSGQVRIVPRIIESIIVSVPGRKILKYELEDFSYHQIDGRPSFRLKFTNQSNVLLRAEANLKIAGTLLADPYELALNNLTILQGETLEKSLYFKNPPLLGGYDATLELNVYEYNAATSNLVYLTTIHRELSFTIIPWGVIVTLIIIILALCCLEHYRRKYLKERLMDTFTHLVKKGETIISIANLYQVNWKTIAKLNKLKRPYTIAPEDLLNLPFPHQKPAAAPKKKGNQSLDKRGK